MTAAESRVPSTASDDVPHGQMVSFVVPAHNEQAAIGRTLQIIHGVAQSIGRPYEIIVVDDASTDATAEISTHRHARVVSVAHRQIAATRNSGARAARGAIIFFIDADTAVNTRVVAAALRAIDRGAAGGGALVRFDGNVPLYARLLVWWLGCFMRLVSISGGAFMFCTGAAFAAVGGFDERLFGAEDAAMCWALKRHGRFTVLWPKVLTSGRRVRGIHGIRMVAGLVRMAVFPKMLTQRAQVQQIWYDSNRQGDDATAIDSPAVRLFNLLALLFMLFVVTGPIWWIPWPAGLLEGPLGTVKHVADIVGLHVGLMLLPCVYFLCRILLRQKRWSERLKLSLLIALCGWIGWGNFWEFLRFWQGVFQNGMHLLRG